MTGILGNMGEPSTGQRADAHDGVAAAGSDFASRVAAWLGVRLLAGSGTPPGKGPNGGRLTRMSYETGLLVVESATRGIAIHAQRSLQVSEHPRGGFARAVQQLVAHHLGAGHEDHHLVLALSPAAKRPVREHLPRFVDAVRHSATALSTGDASLPAGPARAGHTLRHHADEAWRKSARTAPSETDLRNLFDRLTIVVVDLEDEGIHVREAQSLLRNHLVSQPAKGEAAWDALVGVFAQLALERGACDRLALQSLVTAAGVELQTPPDYHDDVVRLSAVTRATLAALEDGGLTVPSSNGPVMVERPVMAVLEQRLARRSVLVTGESGVGKSVVLHHAIRRCVDQHIPVLALTAATVRAQTLSQLTNELGLDNELVDCFPQWAPQRSGVLVIDNLGSEEAGEQIRLWTSVIAGAKDAGWHVAAAVRARDLGHVGGLRALFPPAFSRANGHTLAEFADVHHVYVDGFTDEEMTDLATGAAEFRRLLAEATPEFLGLLRIPFNLRLAGELLQAGIDDRTLRTIRSRLELLQHYYTWVAARRRAR